MRVERRLLRSGEFRQAAESGGGLGRFGGFRAIAGAAAGASCALYGHRAC
ncbi:hypothetical protein LC55x_2090 [Lysobacter capsici]|nr:hypothetical protein LC55x_2090 [Lysobacter capsici]